MVELQHHKTDDKALKAEVAHLMYHMSLLFDTSYIHESKHIKIHILEYIKIYKNKSFFFSLGASYDY